MSLLGIDVETWGCKTGAFSESGECLASAYREYATLHPREGWADLDSREVWNCVQDTIAEVSVRVTSPICLTKSTAMFHANNDTARNWISRWLSLCSALIFRGLCRKNRCSMAN
jgi:glycerol kinase